MSGGGYIWEVCKWKEVLGLGNMVSRNNAIYRKVDTNFPLHSISMA